MVKGKKLYSFSETCTACVSMCILKVHALVYLRASTGAGECK